MQKLYSFKMLVYRSMFYLLFSSHTNKNTTHQALQRLRQKTTRQKDNAEHSSAPSSFSTSAVPANQHQADGEVDIVKPNHIRQHPESGDFIFSFRCRLKRVTSECGQCYLLFQENVPRQYGGSILFTW